MNADRQILLQHPGNTQPNSTLPDGHVQYGTLPAHLVEDDPEALFPHFPPRVADFIIATLRDGEKIVSPNGDTWLERIGNDVMGHLDEHHTVTVFGNGRITQYKKPDHWSGLTIHQLKDKRDNFFTRTIHWFEGSEWFSTDNGWEPVHNRHSDRIKTTGMPTHIPYALAHINRQITEVFDNLRVANDATFANELERLDIWTPHDWRSWLARVFTTESRKQVYSRPEFVTLDQATRIGPETIKNVVTSKGVELHEIYVYFKQVKVELDAIETHEEAMLKAAQAYAKLIKMGRKFFHLMETDVKSLKDKRMMAPYLDHQKNLYYDNPALKRELTFFGVGLLVAPLAAEASVDLLGVSAIPSLIGSGFFDYSDIIHDDLAVKVLYFEDVETHELVTVRVNDGSFKQSIEGNVRERMFKYENILGAINVEFGNVKLWAHGQCVVNGRACTFMGYDLLFSRINPNRRG